jgi:hypothetical protein
MFFALSITCLDLFWLTQSGNFFAQGSVSYPSSMMSRSMYQFIPEILEFKNVEGRLMVLYDLEERLAVSVATNWFEKGIENFAVLTGGVCEPCLSMVSLDYS